MNTNSEETTFSRQLKLFRNTGWNNAFEDCCTEKNQKKTRLCTVVFMALRYSTKGPLLNIKFHGSAGIIIAFLITFSYDLDPKG